MNCLLLQVFYSCPAIYSVCLRTDPGLAEQITSSDERRKICLHYVLTWNFIYDLVILKNACDLWLVNTDLCVAVTWPSEEILVFLHVCCIQAWSTHPPPPPQNQSHSVLGRAMEAMAIVHRCSPFQFLTSIR